MIVAHGQVSWPGRSVARAAGPASRSLRLAVIVAVVIAGVGGWGGVTLPAGAQTSGWFVGNVRITQGYGCTPVKVEADAPVGAHCSPWARKWHQGVDLALPCGTPLYAPAAVTVVSIGEGGTPTVGPGPSYPTVRFADGTMVVLGHARSLVGVGAVVPAGGVIALSGGSAGSGASTGCHLHFEVHPTGGGGFGSGTDINPMGVLNLGGPRITPVTVRKAVRHHTVRSRRHRRVASRTIVRHR